MAVVLQTLSNHLFVARLEDVQRQCHPGKKHHIERKERKKIGHRAILDQEALTTEDTEGR
jgi:hypothetical protein